MSNIRKILRLLGVCFLLFILDGILTAEERSPGPVIRAGIHKSLPFVMDGDDGGFSGMTIDLTTASLSRDGISSLADLTGKSGDLFRPEKYAFVCVSGSALADAVSVQLIRLHENRSIQRLKAGYFEQTGGSYMREPEL